MGQGVGALKRGGAGTPLRTVPIVVLWISYCQKTLEC